MFFAPTENVVDSSIHPSLLRLRGKRESRELYTCVVLMFSHIAFTPEKYTNRKFPKASSRATPPSPTVRPLMCCARARVFVSLLRTLDGVLNYTHSKAIVLYHAAARVSASCLCRIMVRVCKTFRMIKFSKSFRQKEKKKDLSSWCS